MNCSSSHKQMARSLPEMSEEIAVRAQALFHDSALPQLKPMIERGRRFLSSDICIRIARRKGADPAELARQLLSTIQSRQGEMWEQHAGYINITFSDIQAGQGSWNQTRADEIPAVTIYVPPRAASFSKAALVRLGAPAVLQAWLLNMQNRKVELWFGVERVPLDAGTTLPDVFGMLITFAEGSRQSGLDIPAEILEMWRRSVVETCCFYLFPGDVEHTLWREGGRESGFDERVHVFIPDRGWLAEIDDLSPEQSEALGRNPELYLSLLLHLCSKSRGVDIEWHAPFFAERKNLVWCLKSLRQRVADLMSGAPVARPEEGEFPEEIEFLMRFLPDFYFQALSAGEVVAWVDAMVSFLERSSALLNDPSLRIVSASGVLPLGGLCRPLSDAASTIYSFFHVD